MTLSEGIRAKLAHIQQRAMGDNKGVVTMSAEDCDALFDLSLSLIACVEVLENIRRGILPNGDHVEGATVEYAADTITALRDSLWEGEMCNPIADIIKTLDGKEI